MNTQVPSMLRRGIRTTGFGTAFPGEISPPPIPPATVDPERQGGRSPLIDIVPDVFVVSGYLTQLTLPDPLTIDTNTSAWYGLAKVEIQSDQEQELSVIGVECVTLPTDSAGTGGVGSIAWGTTTGQGAAVVVGKDLPTTLGGWTSAPAYVAGVEDAAPGVLTAGGAVSPYVWSGSFPTGRFTDTTPNRLHVIKGFAPGAVRFQAGSTLDIALVVRRAQANGSGLRVIYGHVAVQVLCARPRPGVGFSF